ncbi:hypothetical protein ElyMa_004068700 [Elysia marginata]|uniref:Uncharacterized protein n=1 Tax=Elysia marginata TaxID=1093978 RepID=A0AAV4G8M7_9GAST|nr:hypothetical protein ElyMa_004068700 [Elysia marginata]
MFSKHLIKTGVQIEEKFTLPPPPFTNYVYTFCNHPPSTPRKKIKKKEKKNENHTFNTTEKWRIIPSLFYRESELIGRLEYCHPGASRPRGRWYRHTTHCGMHVFHQTPPGSSAFQRF